MDGRVWERVEKVSAHRNRCQKIERARGRDPETPESSEERKTLRCLCECRTRKRTLRDGAEAVVFGSRRGGVG